MTLSLSEFNITQTVREIMTRYMKLTEQEGYHIKFIADAEAMVMADELKMSQVIYNLINNAINYTCLLYTSRPGRDGKSTKGGVL